MIKDSSPVNQFAAIMRWRVLLLPVLLSIILIFSSYYSYLLFHTLAELFAIIVGVMIFAVAVYTYSYARDNFILYLAIGFFWIAGLDMAHALVYKGMAIYPIEGANHSTQFWITSRFLESLLLLTAPFFLIRRFHATFMFVAFGLMAITFYALIMNGYFPNTFIEGEGLTPFKIVSEYVICSILFLALINLYRHRQRLKADIFPFLSVAIVLTACSEFVFTLYTDVYGLTNLIGHIFKLFAFWLVFYAIVRFSLRAPYEALHTTSSLLTALRDGIPDLIFYKSRDGVYLGCNQAFCDFVGKANEAEIIGTTDYDMFDKELANFFRDKDMAMLEAGVLTRNDEWVTYPDGRKVLLDTLKSPFRDAEENVIGILGVSRDITKRKLVEAALKESEERLKLAVDSGKVGIWDLNLQTNELIWDNNMFALYGAHQEEFSGAYDAWSTRLHPEDRAATEAALRDAIDGLREYASEFRVIWTDGKIRHIKGHAQVINDQAGKPARMIGTNWDITERKQAEIKLKMLFQAIENAGEAVIITDRGAVIEYVNPAFTEITGYTPEEIIGKTPAVLKSSAQDPSFYKELWDTITRGETWHGTLIDRRKDGSFYPALMSVAPIYNDSVEITHFVSLQQDMTQYKKMEDQFLQAQKMEAIGTLVGGIAHDFNNMLAAIQGNVYLSKRKLEGQPEIGEKLDNIELLGMRAADMVKQLLTFARKDRVEMHSFSLNAFIKEAYKLAKTAVPENIELVCDPCQENLMITGDATQLQQALMNLLNNARDAVSDVTHPQISCRLRPFVSTDEFNKDHSDMNGVRFAELVIRDNGSGISKDHLDKVFEPFFTTKGVGEGTGLGLAMVYGTVQSHGGIIEATSEHGVGTAFNIYLPLKEGVETLEKDKIPTIAQGQGETILLVDDEENMRSTIGEVLNSLGYKVLKAGDGKEALEMFKAHQNDIDLILTDIVMPRVGGFDLAGSIRQLNHNVPIIFVTGYDKDQVMSSENQIQYTDIIGKPFSFVNLSRLIRQMIRTD